MCLSVCVCMCVTEKEHEILSKQINSEAVCRQVVPDESDAAYSSTG